MMFQQTLDRLYELRLHGMAKSLEEQIKRGDASDLSFEERLGLLVDQEWFFRQMQRFRHRLKSARLKQSACVEDLDYRTPRGVDRAMMQDLISCRWIRAGRNLIITGPTGIGKTWIACALAENACREGLTAQYTRVPRLIHELAIARADGSFLKVLARLAKLDLLILDDWAMVPLEGQAQSDILEVIDDRAGSRSTLVTSQIPVSKWHDLVGDPSNADALLDRLLGKAIQIQLKGGSLRKEEKVGVSGE